MMCLLLLCEKRPADGNFSGFISYFMMKHCGAGADKDD